VVENTAHGAGLLGEHGLAYWIEWEGQCIWLDTGQCTVLASNAFKRDVLLHKADAVVLSHGHLKPGAGSSSSWDAIIPAW
jgi:7,8-dihydropterin-6-yl-methyl-4-(beta-D-ribofuranosyl)aminobenzene 5'-phosphate synthase